MIDLCREHFPDISAGAYDDPRTRIVIADGTKFVAETDERFDVIMVDSTDPIGPGAVLFTHEFYADCRRALADGGVLVTQNGIPFLQAGELKQSIGYFREMFRGRLRLSRHHAELFRRPDVLWLGDRRYRSQASRARTPSSIAMPRPAASPRAIGAPTCMSRPSRFPIMCASWSRGGRHSRSIVGQVADERAAIGVEGGAHVVRA